VLGNASNRSYILQICAFDLRIRVGYRQHSIKAKSAGTAGKSENLPCLTRHSKQQTAPSSLSTSYRAWCCKKKAYMCNYTLECQIRIASMFLFKLLQVSKNLSAGWTVSELLSVQSILKSLPHIGWKRTCYLRWHLLLNPKRTAH